MGQKPLEHFNNVSPVRGTAQWKWLIKSHLNHPCFKGLSFSCSAPQQTRFRPVKYIAIAPRFDRRFLVVS